MLVVTWRQVSCLAGHRLDPPSRTAQVQWHLGSQLAAHSCRGSCGLGPSLAFMDRTGFPLRPYGHRHEVELAPAWYAAQKSKCRRRTRRPAVACLSRAEAHRFSESCSCWRRHIQGCSRCCGAGQAPRRIGKPVRSRCCPRNGVGASSAVQVPLRALDIREGDRAGPKGRSRARKPALGTARWIPVGDRRGCDASRAEAARIC
jgi:hypothetical protein